jgi:3-deoxy-D-manno-octulosonate 8-phosphate phosphatase (KDO 8-P phosphatase)
MYNINPEYCFIHGDDIPWLSCDEISRFTSPQDSSPEIKAISTTSHKMVVKEQPQVTLAEQVMKVQGKWIPIWREWINIKKKT